MSTALAVLVLLYDPNQAALPTMDAAAVAAAQEIASITTATELEAVIYKDTDGFHYTTANGTGSPDNINAVLRIRIPAGVKIVAHVHSHPMQLAGPDFGEFFSTADMDMYRQTGWTGYIYTVKDHRVRRFDGRTHYLSTFLKAGDGVTVGKL
jgi:hypothetical protein